MTPLQLMALQRFVSATCAFMLQETSGREYLDAKAHLETTFAKKLPPVDLFAEVPNRLPNIL